MWCDFDFQPCELAEGDLAHLILIKNPDHNPTGDFALQDGRVNAEAGDNGHTFSGIAYYHPDLFRGLAYGNRRVAPVLREAMRAGRVSGELYQGEWLDVGTPQRLDELN